jgi:hypothetical protein
VNAAAFKMSEDGDWARGAAFSGEATLSERRSTPSATHYLFLRIVAMVGASPRPLTVSEPSQRLKQPPGIIAGCIARHVYLEWTHSDLVPSPPPPEYWVPAATDAITSDMLRPDRTNRLFTVEEALRDALGTAALQHRATD